MSFPRYPKYRPSGVEWLGDVPEGWDVVPLKQIVSIPVTDGPHETPQFLDEGVPFVSAEAVANGIVDFTRIRGFISAEDDERFSRKYKPRPGDIFLVKSGATTGVTAIVETDSDFNIWSPLAAIRCNSEMSPRFALNYFRSRNFQDGITLNWSFGTQQNIGMGVIENLAILRPPLPEQHAIAAFLDRETAKIDALVAEQRRLIELLQEKRQAVISHAVTKGLDPNVKLKPSGLEWLGDVPEGWSVVGLTKYLESIVDYRGRTPTKVDEGVFLVTARNIRGGRIDYAASEEFVAELEYEDIMRRGKPEIGDVLFTTEAPLGQTANVDRVDVALAQRIIKLRGDHHSLDNSFLKYWIMGDFCQADLLRLATGSTALGIKGSKVVQLRLCLPPISQQREIATHLDSVTKTTDSMLLEAERSIVLLQERRTALISAAVTGKIDVRGIAKPEAA